MWDFFKTAFTGNMHIKNNDICQDCTEYTVTQEGIYVAALSDGASGSRFGDIAARCNVNAVLNYFHQVNFYKFSEYEKERQCKEIINYCVSSIVNMMRNIPDAKYSDFCGTLLFLVSDGEKYIIGHLGDGIICSVLKNGNVDLLSAPDNIESDYTRTYFTLSQDASKHMFISDLNDINDAKAIILMSDGPESSFYDYKKKIMRTKNLNVIINDIAYEPCREMELTYYLKQNFFEHGITGDDCSMVIFMDKEAR